MTPHSMGELSAQGDEDREGSSRGLGNNMESHSVLPSFAHLLVVLVKKITVILLGWLQRPEVLGLSC